MLEELGDDSLIVGGSSAFQAARSIPTEPPGTESPEPEAQKFAAAKGGDLPQGAQKRIDTLTRKRREAEEFAERQTSEMGTLRSEVSRLSQLLEQATQQTEPATWANQSSTDLQRTVAEQFHAAAAHDPEADIQPDPNVFARALKELVQKEVNAAKTDLRTEYTGDRALETAVGQTRSSIRGEFGSDAFNPESELMQEAKSVWRGMRESTGKTDNDLLRENPQIEQLVFQSAAYNLSKDGRMQPNQQAAQQLETLRRQAGVEGGGGLGVAPAEEVNRAQQLLKANDFKGFGNLVAAALGVQDAPRTR